MWSLSFSIFVPPCKSQRIGSGPVARHVLRRFTMKVIQMSLPMSEVSYVDQADEVNLTYRLFFLARTQALELELPTDILPQGQMRGRQGVRRLTHFSQ